MHVNRNQLAGGAKDFGYVSQVVFTLLILRLDLLKSIEQLACVKAIDARIDLTNLSFVGSCILLFDNSEKVALGVANDASVTSGVLHTHTENCACCTGFHMMFD